VARLSSKALAQASLAERQHGSGAAGDLQKFSTHLNTYEPGGQVPAATMDAVQWHTDGATPVQGLTSAKVMRSDTSPSCTNHELARTGNKFFSQQRVRRGQQGSVKGDDSKAAGIQSTCMIQRSVF
jgi:hypothetical protein